MTSSPSFSALRAQRTPKHKLDDATERLIREADVAAVRRAGYARVVVACILLLSVLATTTGRELTDELVRRQVRIGEVTMVLFGVFGLLSAWLASRRIAVPALPAVTATLDAVLILGNLAYSHWGLGVPGALFSTFPVVWVAPIAMAATAIHYHPALQAYVAVLYLAGFSLIAFSGDWLTFGSVFGADELTG
ncbi:hypothetical protein HI113_43900, partial [Corallococcus exiguus]|uniref:hypothetical protein n=1 Tax=Corallococcus exiguus TaxID=83462 RepID=UPI0014740E79